MTLSEIIIILVNYIGKLDTNVGVTYGFPCILVMKGGFFFITGTITSGKLKKDIVKGSMCGGKSDLLL